MAEFDTPHFASPFRMDGSTPVYVEQGSPDELVQNAIVILRTKYGSHEDDVDFGLIPQAFEDVSSITIEDIEAALLRDEPRARALTTLQLEGLVREVQVQLQTIAQEEAGNAG